MKGWRKNLDLSQTIFALTTGQLPSSVAIEKISGPDAFALCEKIFLPKSGEKLTRERGVHFGVIQTPTGEKIDEGIAITFVRPNSHSGEDTVEFHCHGSLPIIQKLERVLVELGARPAERGEFSYRALLHGKTSPADLENLGDLFLAREEADLARIYSRREGSLGARIQRLREQLIRVQAILDTAVDFSEEYAEVVMTAQEPLRVTSHECSEIIQRYSSFRRGSVQPRIVLVGKPNAGKSSLFNALVGRYRAIVHEEAGTTRDVIEEDVSLAGRGWKLVDTAGIRKAEGPIEQEGLSLGEDFLSAARIWLLVVDGTRGLSEAEEQLLEKYSSVPYRIVWNKSDLAEYLDPPASMKEMISQVSVKEGKGIADLWKKISEVADSIELRTHELLPTAVQASRLELVVEKLDRLVKDLEGGILPEYLAEQNREILSQLEGVVGEVSADDVLDRVFGEFCIGK
jgi:tRNA modification GTPase